MSPMVIVLVGFRKHESSTIRSWRARTVLRTTKGMGQWRARNNQARLGCLQRTLHVKQYRTFRGNIPAATSRAPTTLPHQFEALIGRIYWRRNRSFLFPSRRITRAPEIRCTRRCPTKDRRRPLSFFVSSCHLALPYAFNSTRARLLNPIVLSVIF